MIKNKIVRVFAGKGGVGKTTCAAATAVHYASQGDHTLVISTDPTPSLADIFETGGSDRPVKITDCLSMHELGLNEIKQMWDTKFGHEVYEVFSAFVDINYPEFVDFMTSLLPGLKDEFMIDYVRELSNGNEFDVIIWDTAPLGQTLTLLQTPTMLRQHLRMAPRIYSRLKTGIQSRRPVLEIIKQWERLSEENIVFLQQQVQFSVVTIAEGLAVNQLDEILAELSRYELKLSQVIVNNIIEDTSSTFLATRARQQSKYLQLIKDIIQGLPVIELPLFPVEITGLHRLNELNDYLFASKG